MSMKDPLSALRPTSLAPALLKHQRAREAAAAAPLVAARNSREATAREAVARSPIRAGFVPVNLRKPTLGEEK